VDGKMYFALQIPSGLSLLAFRDPNALVQGLNTVPVDQRPPVLPVHIAFQIMVAIGFALLGLSVWLGLSWWRRREMPGSRTFLLGSILAGPGAVVAMEAGWVVTELGRQPWIVYGIMRVDQAVTAARGLPIVLVTLVGVYIVLPGRHRVRPASNPCAQADRACVVTAADAILILLWAGLTAYALFGGADFGAGFWDLLGGGRRTDTVRTLIEDTIGPVWEANHVWLIFALVVVWTAFSAEQRLAAQELRRLASSDLAPRSGSPYIWHVRPDLEGNRGRATRCRRHQQPGDRKLARNLASDRRAAHHECPGQTRATKPHRTGNGPPFRGPGTWFYR